MALDNKDAENVSCLFYPSRNQQQHLVDEFLQSHDRYRKSGKYNHKIEIGSEDYQMYIMCTVGSPLAIEKIFLYCVQTDDVALMEMLFQHVGMNYLFHKHMKLYYSDDKCNGTLQPLFWIAALYGSLRVLQSLVEIYLVYLMESIPLEELRFEYQKWQQQQQQQQHPLHVHLHLPQEKQIKPQSVYELSLEEYQALKDFVQKTRLLHALQIPSNRFQGSTPIHVAVSKNHAQIVSYLLSLDLDPNVTDAHQTTPALLAVSFHHFSIVQELRNNHNLKVDWNKADAKGYTPLLLACEKGHLEIVQYLVPYKPTPLHELKSPSLLQPVSVAKSSIVSESSCNAPLSTVIIASIPVISTCNSSPSYKIPSASHFASSMDKVTFSSSLPSSPSHGNPSPFHQTNPIQSNVTNSDGFGYVALASYKNHSHLIDFFAKNTTLVDLDKPIRNKGSLHHGDTPFLIAVRCNHIACVQAFLQNFNDKKPSFNITAKDPSGRNALHIASISNFVDIVKIMLRYEISDPLTMMDSEDHTGKTPLYYACSLGYADMVDELLHCSDPTIMCRIHDSDETQCQPALLVATEKGHTKIVDSILKKQMDGSNNSNKRQNYVDQTDNYGHTALSIACKLGHLEIVQILVRYGANVNHRSNNGGSTPIQKARKYKHDKIVEFLSEKSAEERRSTH